MDPRPLLHSFSNVRAGFIEAPWLAEARRRFFDRKLTESSGRSL